ncbi:zinc finger HIT domain-containing protein 3-like isoform X2 [Pollicipes pollicipes]|nr:zinc finger HIT domain-containing protein 3-like isoform X2 [Pollicipes pollicipes]
MVPEANEVTTADKTDQRVKWDESTDHMVTREALGWLGESRSLRRLLANEHLRQLVRLADTTDEPDRVMRELMLEPLFVEFTDECLRVVEGGPVSSDEDSD